MADVQPKILERFGNDVPKLPWLGIGFPLGALATNFFWSKICGFYDAKWLFIGGCVAFQCGSALCGAAPSFEALIVGRAIAGAGGAGMYLGALTLIAMLTTIQERPLYMGMTGIGWGLGTVLGPVGTWFSLTASKPIC